ncbi:MAG: MATE family efflux transporter [Synergistaceae bacterium]|nr:MATE family efflux transporter [Synergistaceae bacterium]
MLTGSGKKYEIDMCRGAVLPKMLLFAVPLMCSSILQLLFNAADIIVVGRYAGDNSLAAVGSNTSLIGLLTNLFIGISVGSNVLAARYYGARDEQSLSRTVHTSMLLGVVSGVFLTVVGVAGARRILILMRTPEEVLGLATLYLVIYFFGMTATMVYNFGSAILRAVGDTRRPLFYLVAAGIINVLLNLFFVIYLRLDVAGVALATVISQCVSAALVTRCLMRESGGIRFVPSELRIDREKLIKILRVGLPAGIQGVLFSLSNVVIQSSINSFGAVVMAGSSAAANIETFIYFATNSFYQAVISFTSQNMGAGKIKRIYRILKVGMICSAVVGLTLGLCAVIFGRPLLGVYSSSEAVVSAGMDRMRILSWTYALCGLMDAMVGALRGIGYSVLPTVVTLLGVCGLRLIWIATIFQIPALHTITMVYLSYPVSWLVTFSAHAAGFVWAMKRIEKRR